MKLVLISKSKEKWSKMAKTKVVQKTHICGIRKLRFKRQVNTPRAVPKEGPFVIFLFFLLLSIKALKRKASLKVILVSLTLTARTVFKIFEKTQAITLDGFAAQQQTSTFRREKCGWLFAKFSAKFNELSFNLKKGKEADRKWLKLK